MKYQKEISPVRAALVYAFEPVWAAVISYLGLGLEGDPTFWLFIGAGSLLVGNLIIELEPREIQHERDRDIHQHQCQGGVPKHPVPGPPSQWRA